MAKSTKPKAVNDTTLVDAYMEEFKHPLKAEIEAVRAIIMNADSKMPRAFSISGTSGLSIHDPQNSFI
jgi:hypothetical protein